MRFAGTWRVWLWSLHVQQWHDSNGFITRRLHVDYVNALEHYHAMVWTDVADQIDTIMERMAGFEDASRSAPQV